VTSARPGAPAGEDPTDVIKQSAAAPTAAGPVGLPFSAMLGVLAGLGVLASSMTSLRDIDLYWHILAGRELLAGVPADRIGATWSSASVASSWTTTQWLSEILMAQLHDWSGWTGQAMFRVTTAAATVGVLAWTTLRGRSKALAGFPFLMASALVVFVSQDRPSQFTLIGAAWLGGVLVTGLTRQVLPRWWVLLPVTVLWANLHGGWVLVPMVLWLLALCLALTDGDREPRIVAWSAGLGLAAVAAGCLTPAGLSGLTAPWRFSEAAALISEWAPVAPASQVGWLSVAMLGLLLLGWSASRLPRAEAAAALALLTFSWLAIRNLAPGLVMLAPLTAHRLCAAFPAVGRREPRWSVPAGIAAAALLTVAGIVNVAARGDDNLPTASQPIALAERIAALPAGQRVLNDYNTAGMVLYFGGASTRVAIDGRTDRYGSGYIGRYRDLLDLRGDWQPLLDELDPTAALLEADSPLAGQLLREWGWQQVGAADSGYILLVPGPAAG
jgi:hypothetical protein